VHLVGFIIDIYYEARPYEGQSYIKFTIYYIMHLYSNWALPGYCVRPSSCFM